MSPLIYLIRKSLKNTVLSILRSRGKRILWIIVFASILGIIALSIFSTAERDPGTIAPLFWFTGILFLFIMLFVILSVMKGISGGDTMFEMNDVNLLFISPISSRAILLYGVIKMTKTAFFACFFLLFQSSTLANFGVNFGGVLLTLAGTILSIVTLTVLSLVIYSKTNGNQRRKLAVKLVTALLFVPFILFAAIQYFDTNNALLAIENAIKSPFLQFIPVAGWTASGVTAFISGKIAEGFLWFGANVLLLAGLIIYILLSNPDYYEDVLVATETAYEKKRALAEGNQSSISKKKVKLSKTGVSGSGASAIFGKHTRESFRENRFGFLTLPSVLIAVGAIILAVLFGDISILIYTLPWAQIFLIGTGRGMKDLTSHFIYMIPESSFKKLIWSNMEILARTLIENILMFGIAGIILQSSFHYILIFIALYTLFSFMLLGVNYAIMRLTGADVSAGILLLIYYFAVIIIMIPGLVAGIIVGVLIGDTAGYLLGLTIFALWELVAGSICFWLARGVLHNCDMR